MRSYANICASGSHKAATPVPCAEAKAWTRKRSQQRHRPTQTRPTPMHRQMLPRKTIMLPTLQLLFKNDYPTQESRNSLALYDTQLLSSGDSVRIRYIAFGQCGPHLGVHFSSNTLVYCSSACFRCVQSISRDAWCSDTGTLGRGRTWEGKGIQASASALRDAVTM
jgi:hypothetical protein